MQTRRLISILSALRSWQGAGKGSALVGVVAITLVMAIGGVGMLGLTGSTVNQELTALEDARAFQAAESGLWLGSRWLREKPNLRTAINGSVSDLFSSSPLVVNGHTVTVDIVRGTDDITVRSRAASNNDLGYDKELSWRVPEGAGGFYGTYINLIDQTNTQGYKSAAFDGSFHSNTAIWFAEGVGGAIDVSFSGPVSVHNRTGIGPGNEFDWVPFPDFSTGDWDDWDSKSNPNPVSPATGNDYTLGITKKTKNLALDFDDAFASTYRHSQPELALEFDPTGVPIVTLGSTGSTDNLDSPSTRPTLEFYVDMNGAGRFRYYHASNGTVVTEGAVPADGVIFEAQQQHLNVQGEVNGKVTVVTDTGFDIYSTGDLTYYGYDKAQADNKDANYGLDGCGDNVCALYSGRNIGFGPNAYDPGTAQESVMGEQYVTAQLVAVINGGSHVWKEKNNSTEFDIAKYGQDYMLKGIGSRTLDSYLYFKETAQNPVPVDFYFDQRLGDGLLAPGVYGFVDVTDPNNPLLKLAFIDWKQRNIVVE